jgi:hypothetical protein
VHREIQAQIADLPQNNPHHGGGGRVKRTLYSANWSRLAPKLNRWTDKLRNSELDVRNGAWRRFDIDEAIKTSDRRKAEQAAKKPVPDEEGPGE